MNKYGPNAKNEIAKTMRAYKQLMLHSGKSGAVVTDHDQAVAIGIAKVRHNHYKVPGITRKKQ